MRGTIGLHLWSSRTAAAGTHLKMSMKKLVTVFSIDFTKKVFCTLVSNVYSGYTHKNNFDKAPNFRQPIWRYSTFFWVYNLLQQSVQSVCEKKIFLENYLLKSTGDDFLTGNFRPTKAAAVLLDRKWGPMVQNDYTSCLANDYISRFH